MCVRCKTADVFTFCLTFLWHLAAFLVLWKIQGRLWLSKKIQIFMIISCVKCNLHRSIREPIYYCPSVVRKLHKTFCHSYYKFDIWFKVSNHLYQVQIGAWSRVGNRLERNFSLCSQLIWGSPDVKHHGWSGDFVYKALGVIVITRPEVQGLTNNRHSARCISCWDSQQFNWPWLRGHFIRPKYIRTLWQSPLMV